MTRSNEKKLKRLKSHKLWPSIIGFGFFIAFSIIIISIAFTVFLHLLFASDALSASESSQDFIERVKALNITKDTPSAKALVDAQNTAHIDYALRDGEGEFYVSSSDTQPLSEQQNFLIYASEAAVQINLDDGKNGAELFNSVNIFTTSYRTIESLTKEDSLNSRWFERDIFAIDYWIGCPLSDSDGADVLFIKSTLHVRNRDTLLLVLMLTVFVILLVIPIMSMFLHMISSIHTQQKLLKLFYTDLEIGGKNWHYFKQQAEKILNRRLNAKKGYVLVDLQMNKYRNYSACYGVKAAAELLEQVQIKLKKQVKRGELSAHYAKADFALLLKYTSDAEVESRILAIMQELCNINAKQKISFCAGVFPILAITDSSIKKRQVRVDDLFNYAGTSKSKITDFTENQLAFFDDKLLAAQQWEQQVADSMEAALANEEFKVFIQPKYHPVTKELSGAEALVRWISPTEGFISPGRFIPIFESNGFIIKLDDYMISHVAALQSKWLEEGKKVVPISVNVSRAHFAKPDLAEHICALVDAHHTPHELIELELTESAFFDDKQILLSTVEKLKSYGFEISMDDFGAGYSSLNSLKDLPLDILKLDAEFFRGELANPRSEIVVSQAIRLAKDLNMRIVAEGIEKKEQVDFLADVGCDMIQGFYFAKPMPVEEYESTALNSGYASVDTEEAEN